MNNFIKNKLIGLSQGMAIFMWLAGILLTSSCHGGLEPNVPNNKNVSNIELHQELPDSSEAGELIVFCGDPGVGKSSLCNSIFQENVFKSGASNGGGITQHKQEYIYENRKYVDTPGLSDVKLREQAAAEIEKALKKNNNYKIVFVAMLNNGRIRASDLTTINTVCDAIKTPFEYGIIFNQVPIKDTKRISLEGLGKYLSDLHKQPSSTVIITRDENIEGEENAFLSSNSENRTNLMGFIASLRANMIEDKQVQAIDVRTYDKLKEEIELKLNEALKQYEAKQQRRDEENRRLIEQQRQETERQRREYEEEQKRGWEYFTSQDLQAIENFINTYKPSDVRGIVGGVSYPDIHVWVKKDLSNSRYKCIKGGWGYILDRKQWIINKTLIGFNVNDIYWVEKY